MIYTAFVQVNSGEIFLHQLGLVREPVWAWMRQCCPFTDMSANAVFSEVFQVNTFGELTFDWKSLFPIQHSNHSICSQCNQQIIKSTDVVVLYITHQHIHQNGFESSVSEAMLPNINKLCSLPKSFWKCCVTTTTPVICTHKYNTPFSGQRV